MIRPSLLPVCSGTSDQGGKSHTSKTVSRWFHERGSCTRGSACPFFHNVNKSHQKWSKAAAVGAVVTQNRIHTNEKMVFVGRLPQDCNYWQIRQWASTFGQCQNIAMHQGYAIVTFAHTRSARSALFNYDSNNLICPFATNDCLIPSNKFQSFSSSRV